MTTYTVRDSEGNVIFTTDTLAHLGIIIGCAEPALRRVEHETKTKGFCTLHGNSRLFFNRFPTLTITVPEE